MPAGKQSLGQRVARNPTLLKRALADPGLRSKLPSRYLTAKQRKTRNLNTRLNAPLVPGGDTSYRDFARQRNTQERLTFGPQYQELRNEKNNLAAQRQRDTSYFDQYRGIVEEAQRKQAELAQQANTAAAGVAASAQGASQQSNEQTAAAQRQAAAKSGAPFDEAAYRQMAGAAAAVRNTGAQQQVAQVAGEGVSANALLGQLAVASHQDKGARLDQLTGAEKKLQKAKQTLTSKKADWRTQFYYDQMNEARKRVLENQAYNLDVAKAQSDAAGSAADADAKSLKVNKWGYTDREWAALSVSERTAVKKQDANLKDPTTKDPKTPKKKWDSSDKHVTTFKELLGGLGSDKNTKNFTTPDNLANYLRRVVKRRGGTYPDSLIQAAAEVQFQGAVTRKTRNRINKELNIRWTPFGYPVKDWKPPKPVKSPKFLKKWGAG